MQKKERDWTNWGQFGLAIVLVVISFATAWGATRAQASSTIAQVESLSTDVGTLQQDVNNLKTGGAVNAESLKNINEKLEELKKQLERISNKLDTLKTK